MEFLKGKKTYFIGACMAVGAVGAYLSDQQDLAASLMGQALVAFGLRAAIAKAEIPKG